MVMGHLTSCGQHGSVVHLKIKMFLFKGCCVCLFVCLVVAIYVLQKGCGETCGIVHFF